MPNYSESIDESLDGSFPVRSAVVDPRIRRAQQNTVWEAEEIKRREEDAMIADISKTLLVSRQLHATGVGENPSVFDLNDDDSTFLDEPGRGPVDASVLEEEQRAYIAWKARADLSTTL